MGCGGSKAVSTFPRQLIQNKCAPSVDSQSFSSSRLGSAGMDSMDSSDIADDSSTVPDKSDWQGQMGSPEIPESAVTRVEPILPPLHVPVIASENSQLQQIRTAKARAIAFEIPLDESGESLVQRHPPLALRSLTQGGSFSLEEYQGKHSRAAQRRQMILKQRVQSARNYYQRSTLHVATVENGGRSPLSEQLKVN